jgi:REP-associated tyrosine transposase
MARSARILLPDHIYHLTHRCHNGSFFLRFDVALNEYRQRLWQAVGRYGIIRLNFCITSNHTHLLLKVRRPGRISVFMRHLEGEFAACYNRRKHRRGAFWSERYHATLIEDGTHFWNCMHYIDLNMVRAGVVDHPDAWLWCGFQEIDGHRQRFRILNLRELQRAAGINNLDEFSSWYRENLNRVMRTSNGRREPHWTESVAVGSEAYVRHIADLTRNRKRLEISEWADGAWYVSDAQVRYGI